MKQQLLLRYNFFVLFARYHHKMYGYEKNNDVSKMMMLMIWAEDNKSAGTKLELLDTIIIASRPFVCIMETHIIRTLDFFIKRTLQLQTTSSSTTTSYFLPSVNWTMFAWTILNRAAQECSDWINTCTFSKYTKNQTTFCLILTLQACISRTSAACHCELVLRWLPQEEWIFYWEKLHLRRG